jgi:hypothetical protein
LPGKSVAEQFNEHQRLVDVAHAHALGDGLAEALVGGGGVPGLPESLDFASLRQPIGVT